MFLKVLQVLITVLYPLLVLGVLRYGQSHLGEICAVVSVGTLGWSVYRIWRREWFKSVMPIVLSILLLAVALTESSMFVKLYPVMVTGLFLVQFGLSHWGECTVVERLARLQTPDLPPAAVRYCRRVSGVWCVFFFFSMLAALYTVFWCSDEVWALYNGCISYILIGVLMAGEWVVRQFVVRT